MIAAILPRRKTWRDLGDCQHVPVVPVICAPRRCPWRAGCD